VADSTVISPPLRTWQTLLISRAFQAVVLVAVTLLAYSPALRGGFIWDDPATVSANELVKAPDGLGRLWFSTAPADYWPVTYTSFWLEWRRWGDAPFGYHLTNLVLQMAAAFLWWAVLRELGVPGAWLAALLFAVHPVNVETVAWITQRKTILALIFFLLSGWGFLKTGLADVSALENARGRWTAPGRAGWYWFSLAAFVLAMLSKGSAAMLPVVLLGLMWWKRRLVWDDALRLAPFFVIAGVLVVANIWFQTHGDPETYRQVNALQRVLGAGAVIWFYLGRAVLPVHLLFLYPQWDVRAGDPVWWLPLAAALGVTLVLWRARRGWGRPWLAAWGFFCVSLVPVMGFVDSSFMRFSLVADHYQYLALGGVAALAAAEWARGWDYWRGWERAVGVALAAVVVGLFVWQSRAQCRLYADPDTLYRGTLAGNPDCWLFHFTLGHELAEQNRTAEAAIHFRQALALNPEHAGLHDLLGNALSAEGRVADAIPEYRAAVRLAPEVFAAHDDLGRAYFETGRYDAAALQFYWALRCQPDDASAHNDLGMAWLRLGRTDAARAQFELALSFDPKLVLAHNNLGGVLLTAGDLAGAIAQFEQAVRLDPLDPLARSDLGVANLRAGHFAEAVTQYEAALRLQPDDASIQNNLGIALFQSGRPNEAMPHFVEALALQADYAEARDNLGVALLRLGRTAEAAEQFARVLRDHPDDAKARRNLANIRQ
jgi:Flp pilus assembly protein TadD